MLELKLDRFGNPYVDIIRPRKTSRPDPHSPSECPKHEATCGASPKDCDQASPCWTYHYDRQESDWRDFTARNTASTRGPAGPMDPTGPCCSVNSPCKRCTEERGF